MDKKLFIGLFFLFIGMTIVGTLSHELGHFIVAKYFGFEARINYGATYWRSPDPHHPILLDNPIAITLGGPVQTILTGTIGLLLLFRLRRGFYQARKLSVKQWLIVFMALFWLRQTANFCTWIGGYFLNGSFSSRSDEIQIARHFSLPDWTVIGITALIGALILAVITFRFLPVKQRLTFLVSGLTGGIAGYLFWLVWFGKYIMP